MKILLISTRFYPHVGGVENVVEMLAKHLSERHTVEVIASLELSSQNITGRNPLMLQIQKVLRGFQTYQRNTEMFPYPVARFWLNFPRTLMGYLSFPYRASFSSIRFVRYVRVFHPDVINYHFPDDSALYVWILLKFIHVPLVVNIHGNDLHVFNKQFPQRMFVKSVLKQAHRIVVNSDYMKEDAISEFESLSSKIKVISNGIDLQKVFDVKPKPYFPEEYAFFVGRLVYKKGVDILLHAIALVKDIPLKFLVEGKGEELEMLQRLAKKLRITETVTFSEGSLSADEKTAAMKSSVMGIMPSRIEPFGIVALEMMACGIPIVASRTGGLVSVLKEDRNCLFFENGDAQDLADKIRKLYADSELQDKMRERNLRDVEHFDNKEIAKEYESLFQSLQ